MLAWTIERSFCKMLNEQSTPKEREALADMLTHTIWSALASAGG